MDAIQALTSAQHVIDVAQKALEQDASGSLTLTAQPLAHAVAGLSSTGLSPLQLSFAIGPLLAHSAPLLLSKIPSQYQHAVQDVGTVVTTAGVAVSQGSTWQSALGYGIATAFSARIYHRIALHPNGLLASLANFANGFKSNQPVAMTMLTSTGQGTDQLTPKTQAGQ